MRAFRELVGKGTRKAEYKLKIDENNPIIKRLTKWKELPPDSEIVRNLAELSSEVFAGGFGVSG